MQFHRALLVPAIRRTLYFVSSIATVVILFLVAGKENWWLPAIGALGFVLVETVFYDSKRSFFPPVLTFGKMPEKTSPAATEPTKKTKKTPPKRATTTNPAKNPTQSLKKKGPIKQKKSIKAK